MRVRDGVVRVVKLADARKARDIIRSRGGEARLTIMAGEFALEIPKYPGAPDRFLGVPLQRGPHAKKPRRHGRLTDCGAYHA